MNRQAFFKHVAQTSAVSLAMEVERAEGVYLYGPDGKRWVDFISGICVSNVGHCAPEVVSALQSQSERYLHTMVYGDSIMSPQVQYAQKLTSLLAPGLDKVYFGNSGAEAMEGALKVAKKFTGRTQIISCYNAYHGSTHGALSVGGNARKRLGYGPFLPGVSFIQFNRIGDLAKITHRTAAVCVEAIQGAGGVILPEPGYLAALRQRCTETGTLLILDEIQTGLGRTGTLWAHEQEGFVPDILLLAKALGGGLPMGAFITREEVVSVIQDNPFLGHINTFGGGPMAAAAGLATLNKILDEDLLARVPILEQILQERLQHPAITTLRGRGLMYAVLFASGEMAQRIQAIAFELGLLTIGFLHIKNGLRIAPPLTMTDAEMHEACDILLEAITAGNQRQRQ
ncbi:MAG: aspartate aminotransferase family protein [Bacteroidota bacterium]